MCGGGTGSVTMDLDFKPVIHGDLLNSDTRNVLAILDIGEVDFIFKATNPINSIESALSTTQLKQSDGLHDIDDYAKFTPIIVEHSKRIMGSSQEMVVYSCTKDRRNKPKLNEKGKVIKVKKGTPLAKSLYPLEPNTRAEIERMMNWFQTKFRPYT